MKTFITLLLLTLSISLKAQQKSTIYYDNRDNSVVNFFSKPNVSKMLAENSMCGFSTINFTVSDKGKVIAIQNLLNVQGLFFRTAKDAIERSSGSWIIKPGLKEQTFQISFFITTDRLDSLRIAGKNKDEFQIPVDRYVNYNDTPKELTILPTIKIIYKQAASKPFIVQ
ncbi:hypothetical protein [Pedobacter cryoconitis]|uniref:TonB-like protein n=1 Tax=Pedobacter cryoconitis TaxID=188932 RepID=A0A7X0JAU6_9SPHI|nr:hypothetical protein [Pedobacter cryoconitis]MBB6503006.1 hypothetical protein [Pedobacter cryoconitis]